MFIQAYGFSSWVNLSVHYPLIREIQPGSESLQNPMLFPISESQQTAENSL